MKRLFAVVSLALLVFLNSGCTVKLSGASIPPELKTINVEYFENNAQLVVNYLSQQFTEALKDRIRTTTSLSIVQGDANAKLSGSITGYSIAPVSIQATNNNVAPIAGASKLTITVSVKYVGNQPENKKDSFEETFSKSENFTGDINSHEQALIADINKQLTEDIFNKAFDNW